MDNTEFLHILEKSFSKYIETGPRSNKKLIILHGAIARDLKERLGPEYKVQSLGVGDDREGTIKGRYMDKKVDLTISKNGKILGGIAVKYVMSNYAQNSNNYFENMLGETANVRCNKMAYFQLIVLPKHMPYFNNSGVITKIEDIKQHHVDKYLRLSEDNPEVYMHTPTKTLFVLVDHVHMGVENMDKKQYTTYYSSSENTVMKYVNDKFNFDSSVIYNDYNDFIDKVQHYIKSM